MRDEHRFREKIELSLEGRHVRAIALAAVLFLGVAFSLGVLVGKRLASRAISPAGLDDLAALDSAVAPGRDGTSSPRGGAEVIRPGTAGRAESTRPGTTESTRPGTSASARNEIVPTSDTGKMRESVASPVPLPPSDSADKSPKRQVPVRTIPAPPSATSVPPAADTIRVAPPQTAVLPAPPLDLGKFTVQVGATQDRMEAREMVARASKGGQRPYVAEARLAGRGLWYRVRLGAFADRPAAERYRRDVERELGMPAMVMPTR